MSITELTNIDNRDRDNFPLRFRGLAESILAAHRADEPTDRGMLSWEELATAYDEATTTLADPQCSRRERVLATAVIRLAERMVCAAYVVAFGGVGEEQG